MINDRMALIDSIEKGKDGDLVRDLLAYRRVTALLQAAGGQVGKDQIHPSRTSG